MLLLKLGQVIDILVYDNPETTRFIMGRHSVLRKDTRHSDQGDRPRTQRIVAIREADYMVGRTRPTTNEEYVGGDNEDGQENKTPTTGKR